MTDYIKREDAIKAIMEQGWIEDNAYAEIISNLPSADVVDQKTGEWTIQNCHKCGKFVLKNWIVCPYCGASMRPKDGEEE